MLRKAPVRLSTLSLNLYLSVILLKVPDPSSSAVQKLSVQNSLPKALWAETLEAIDIDINRVLPAMTMASVATATCKDPKHSQTPPGTPKTPVIAMTL